MWRARISAGVSDASKAHLPLARTIGTRNGQSSSPIARIVRFGFMGDTSKRCRLRASRANSDCSARSCAGSPETRIPPERAPKIAANRAESWLSAAVMRAWAAASGVSHCCWAIAGAAQIAAGHVLSPSTAANPSATKAAATCSTAEATSSNAGEAPVALHPCHSTVVVSAENPVISGPAALLEARTPEPRFDREPSPAEALFPSAGESIGPSAKSGIAPESCRNLAITIRDS